MATKSESNELAGTGRALDLDDEALLRQCRIETTRGTGPGGQHRNKTDSGVRLHHLPTGCIGQAFERRSQRQNRDEALVRLRQAIALGIRTPVDPSADQVSPALAALLPGHPGGPIGPNNPRYWSGVQILLDLLVALGCSVAETASQLRISTGGLSRVLVGSPELMTAVNALRASRGLHPLRR
ncbi:MAG: peptide chain release factor-like protein [Dehalococcoidia bacterium]